MQILTPFPLKKEIANLLIQIRVVNHKIKYVHTNIIARDWKKLAQFYIDVFDCKPVYPERDLSGDWVDKLTNISGVHIKGIHLALPGYEDGPTLEIFGYNITNDKDGKPLLINNTGLAHIAFHVEHVEVLLKKLIDHGGKAYGALVEKEYNNIGIVTVIYATDPEGNIIEIQNWRRG